MFLFQFGFLDITFWDILDVTIVGYLLFRIYKLLKGSLAFSIFIGVGILYVLWWVVKALGMSLLSEILTQVVNVGVLALVVVFQPEIRRFLIYLGRGTFARQFGMLQQWFRGKADNSPEKERQIRAILRAVEQLSKTKTGALMVFTVNPNLQEFNESGTILNASIAAPLLISIFNKESPLHDGAVIISDGKIIAASCVLPVSHNPDIPARAGLRHRASVGITEGTDAFSLIVSEETGGISYAKEGQLHMDVQIEDIRKLLSDIFAAFY
jgi:uncharacterized protein (TIGR00159 family)